MERSNRRFRLGPSNLPQPTPATVAGPAPEHPTYQGQETPHQDISPASSSTEQLLQHQKSLCQGSASPQRLLEQSRVGSSLGLRHYLIRHPKHPPWLGEPHQGQPGFSPLAAPEETRALNPSLQPSALISFPRGAAPFQLLPINTPTNLHSPR